MLIVYALEEDFQLDLLLIHKLMTCFQVLGQGACSSFEESYYVQGMSATDCSMFIPKLAQVRLPDPVELECLHHFQHQRPSVKR